MLKDGPLLSGPVVYWMHREHRAEDNWALLFAQELARERRAPLIVLYCLAPSFLGAALRQYAFLLNGLEEVEQDLRRKHIPLVVACGKPEREIAAALRSAAAEARMDRRCRLAHQHSVS